MVNVTFFVVILLVTFVFVVYITRNTPIIAGPSYGYGYSPGFAYGGYGGGGPTIVVNDFDSDGGGF
jgi:hypothetical protein